MKNKISKAEYDQILKYAKNNKLKRVVKMLEKDAEEFLLHKVPLRNFITEQKLREFGCCCFLTAIQFLTTGQKQYYLYANYSHEMEMFDIDKLVINSQELVWSDFDQHFEREKIQFDFKYIDSIVNDVAKNQDYDRLTLEQFNKCKFTPAQMKEYCVALSSGRQGEASHYEVVCVKDVCQIGTTTVYIKKGNYKK